MSDYYFEGGADKWNVLCMIHFIMSLVTLVLVIVILVQTYHDSFANLEDSIKSKHDLAVSLPVQDERTLRQKLAEAEALARQNMAAQQAEGLTGTRDIPVFYQDYGLEAKSKGGAVYQEREGFQGALSQDDLEKMLRN